MTRYICSECGSEIPPDSDFCYHCGCEKKRAFRIDDSGNIQQQKLCPECRIPMEEDAKFCRHCGLEVGGYQTADGCAGPYCMMPPKPVKNGTLAIALSFLLGFFGIYGVGHFVMKRWSRGIMFLAMSAVNWYIYLSVGNFVMVVMLISLFIFFKQASETTMMAYGRI